MYGVLFRAVRLADTLTLNEATDNELEERATTEYLLQQLILSISYLDISDPISRYELYPCMHMNTCITGARFVALLWAAIATYDIFVRRRLRAFTGTYLLGPTTLHYITTNLNDQ